MEAREQQAYESHSGAQPRRVERTADAAAHAHQRYV